MYAQSGLRVALTGDGPHRTDTGSLGEREATGMGGASGGDTGTQSTGEPTLPVAVGLRRRRKGRKRCVSEWAGWQSAQAQAGGGRGPPPPNPPRPLSLAAHGACPCALRVPACPRTRLRTDHLRMCAYLYLNGRFGNYVQLKGRLELYIYMYVCMHVCRYVEAISTYAGIHV